MREVAAQVATVDPVKIAILAALNIADEFSRYRKQRNEKTEELSRRLTSAIS
jgi:cell division protein ZapA (FtsZ GTPase activity inhibitor)